MLPSPKMKGSALRTIKFSVLNTLPTSAAVNASSVLSRPRTHDSRRSMNRLILCSGGLSPPVHHQFAWLFHHLFSPPRQGGGTQAARAKYGQAERFAQERRGEFTQRPPMDERGTRCATCGLHATAC